MLQNIVHHTNTETKELRGLFEKQLRELYWAESVVGSMLKNTILDSTSGDLISVLEKQHSQAPNHMKRLEEIFEAIGIAASILPYEALKCMTEELSHITKHINAGVVRDAAIIAVLQKIKHYEIACYGTMRAYAIALREEDVVTLLEQTLEEEKTTDLALSHIAESHINIEAADKEI